MRRLVRRRCHLGRAVAAAAAATAASLALALQDPHLVRPIRRLTIIRLAHAYNNQS